MSTLKSLSNKPGDMLPGQRYNLTPSSIYGKGPSEGGGRPFSLSLSYDTRSSIQPASASFRPPVVPLYSTPTKLWVARHLRLYANRNGENMAARFMAPPKRRALERADFRERTCETLPRQRLFFFSISFFALNLLSTLYI